MKNLRTSWEHEECFYLPVEIESKLFAIISVMMQNNQEILNKLRKLVTCEEQLACSLFLSQWQISSGDTPMLTRGDYFNIRFHQSTVYSDYLFKLAHLF